MATNRRPGRLDPRLTANGKSSVNVNELSLDGTSWSRRFESAEATDKLDDMMGFARFESGPKKVAWLVNMHPTSVKSEEVLTGQGAVDYYFLDDEGGSFKATVKFDPYFLLSYRDGHESEIEEFLRRRLEGILKKVQHLDKEDLSLPNHLVGIRRKLLKLDFHNVSDLLVARRELMPTIQANKQRQETVEGYSEVSLSTLANDPEWNESSLNHSNSREALDYITEIHEYDVPYHVRVAIDKNIRIGKWYTVAANNGSITLNEIPERVARADPVVLAFDIETTKAPLKFPDSSFDKVIMISYMIDGEGFLITNREIISKDIDDFEYTPKPEFKGVFTVFNEENEKDTIARFFEHIKEEKPTVIATFNGDFFDWPFIEARAAANGLDMYQAIGFRKDAEEEYKSTYCAHLDCFRWVKRDSYLPQGSQGLKAVTTAKLGYNPLEIDPELMTPYSIEKPQVMAEYSVSDAVATYYLYMKYVHPFIFSLCNIIPLNPDEVLRKGTGTLCEMLLMVQAYEKNILLPNKHSDPAERFYDGHLVESETYVGGHVESLEAGVFRSDIPSKFNVDPNAIDELLDQLDRALRFNIEVEGKKQMKDVANYEEVKEQITRELVQLRDQPNREECPSIYHVDVASMYPNIMTTNRLQPDSMITEENCASCDFNRPGKTCDRRLPWSWRVEYLPAKKDEYLMIRNSLKNEVFPGKGPRGKSKTFDELSSSDQASLIKKRLTEYSRRVYHKIKQTETIEREAIICQRENPFYVNTVRDFRDRRYEFKGLAKVWKKNVDEVPKDDAAGKEEAKKMVVLYDSLQLAHKVILNSFYGYVMRKGSRWYSMEMAGVTCLTGATIIQMARALVERIGRPLELDTDGIWCILPKSFPEDFAFKLKDGKKLFLSYPCVMLNHLVHERFTNHQYQTLVDKATLKYETMSDNSIFFEVDGPYKAMILPTSKEEDKGLKKRYAVFNDDGSLAELKGFEVKRRGELRLIKAFQSQIFKVFLDGNTLEECYGAVAKVANSWLDILESRGMTLENDDLIDLISENRSMSKTLEEYGGQKSTSICTARRLAEFLGSQMVKDKGLACKYVISKKPLGSPITDRAVPVAIFSAETSVKAQYLRKWLKDSSLEDFDPRAIIDWDYYTERFASQVQKIITIPAAYQHVKNPVPRIIHPDWLTKRINTKSDKLKQQSVTSFFTKSNNDRFNIGEKLKRINNRQEETNSRDVDDIEDFGDSAAGVSKAKIAKVSSSKKRKSQAQVPSLEEQFASLSSTDVDPNEDYPSWLRYQKLMWKLQKRERDRRQHLFGESASSRNNAGITGMIRNQNEKAYSSMWNILQLSESNNAGQVQMTVCINDNLQTVKVNIPRVLYINFKNKLVPEILIPGCIVEKSAAVLPNGSSAPNLYRLTMPEDIYQQELVKAKSILKHKFISGIFESQLDLHERVILELGKQCSLDDTRPGLLGKGLERGFDLNWLVPQTENSNAKLNINYIHIHHVVSHDFQVISIIPTWNDRAMVLVLRPSSQSQNLPNINRLYQNMVFEKSEGELHSKELKYQDRLNFSDEYFDRPAVLYKKVNAALSKLHAEKGTKSIVVIQSPQLGRLKKLVRSLNDFPLVTINAQDAALPSLGWQAECAKRIVKSYMGLGKWLVYLSSLSSFSNVPIGNLKGGNCKYLIDVIYARRLKQANILLWWTPGPIPDRGGFEKDTALMSSVDNLDLPIVNNPGLYTKVCVEFSIRNLPVNTILTAAIINEAEGHNMEIGDSESFLENSFSIPALGVLSSLVKEWWNQAVKEDANADMMVYNFVGWVSSPDSMLYDRSLYYHVQNLAKKSFIQLMREFRRFGAQLVYANQNRVVILTNKSSVENSFSIASYIVKSIRSKALFNFLDIEIKEYWDTLLWMDEVNYGGKSCKEITSAEFSGGSVVLETYLNWHIKKFLPVILQTELEDWIVDFLNRLTDLRNQHNRAIVPGDANDRATQISNSALQRSNGVEDENAHFAISIFKDMEPMLVKRMKQLFRRYMDSSSNEDARTEFEFPLAAGSYQKLRNPILQLIKTLSAIFGLPQELSLEARVLRRQLLKIVDVREFSDEGVFKNPSTSLKVCQLVCKHCSYVCDMDLCRNDFLVKMIDSQYTFVCENCNQDYDRVELEERLVQELQRLMTLFQVQDLKCEKCKRIRESDLTDHCECSGAWMETLPRCEVSKKVQIYKDVSNFYDMELLQSVVVDVEQY